MSRSIRRPSRLAATALSCLAVGLTAGIATSRPAVAQSRKPVKVFVLAGQSNMEGKAQNKLFEFQATDAKTKELFAHLRKGDDWVERDDVFVKFGGRQGKLTLGYGSRDRTGPELEFGFVVGDHFDEPVLLLKTAWGGHSLDRQFRPPSAGMPSDERLATELAQAQERTAKRNEKNKRDDPLPTLEAITAVYGSSYRNMIAEVREVMKSPGTVFPELKRRKAELAGFVWFQGWNDQYGGVEVDYAENLAHLIRDVRKDLEAPKLPVVIGAMGQNGSKPAKGAMKVIQDAQIGIAETAEFRATVRTIRTDALVDTVAEEHYPTWRQNFETWETVGSDRPYHYLGSAIWFTRIGHAFGEAMLELIGD